MTSWWRGTTRALVATTLLVALSLSGTPTGPAAADGASPPAVPVNDCWSTDNGMPALTELHLGADSVDTTSGPVTVPVTARAVDTGGPGPATGVTSIGVFVGVVAKPKIGGDNQIVRLTPTPDGTWTGLVTVPQWGVRDPVWRVHQVYVQDAAGNLRVMTLDQLVAAGLSPELSVTSSRDVDEPDVADVTVSPRRVDVRRGARWVQFGVRAVDATSGVRTVTVGQTILHRVSGTTTDGWWRGRVRVHRFDHTERYRLTVRVTDAAGFLRVAGGSAAGPRTALVLRRSQRAGPAAAPRRDRWTRAVRRRRAHAGQLGRRDGPGDRPRLRCRHGASRPS